VPPRTPIVLIVEDDPVNQSLLTEVCRGEGYLVATADDGEAALVAIASRVVDLVLLDAALPKIDGFEVCRRIRQTTDVPVIIVSASPEEQARGPALEAGAVAFVSKPFRIYELSRLMRIALTTSRSPSEPPSSINLHKRRSHALALERIESAMHFRQKLRRDAQHGAGQKSLVIARLVNERSLLASQGRMARDAVLGILVEQVLHLVVGRQIFWTDSNELAVLTLPESVEQLLDNAPEVISLADALGIRDADLRFGCVHYRVGQRADIDIILQRARSMCDEASRSDQRWAVSRLETEHLISAGS